MEKIESKHGSKRHMCNGLLVVGLHSAMLYVYDNLGKYVGINIINADIVFPSTC